MDIKHCYPCSCKMFVNSISKGQLTKDIDQLCMVTLIVKLDKAT